MKTLHKLLATSLLVAAAPLAFAAQESRDLPTFKSITSQGVYRLVVTSGQPQSVVVSGDEGMLTKLSTKVVGDDLVISLPEENHVKWKEKLTITIGVAQLAKLQMEGVGDTSLSQLSGDKFQLHYRGVGSLSASGHVQNFVLDAEGVGTINARDLDAKSVQAHLAGVGSAKVRASESLNATLEGVGSLTYYGNPKQVSKSSDGIGSVRAAD